VINNAYGVHSIMAMTAISKCYRVGRIDAVVQSTDKNFMVPVGGAILVGPSIEWVNSVATLYPGRASLAPVMDIFITLLSMGIEGFKRLQNERRVSMNQNTLLLSPILNKDFVSMGLNCCGKNYWSVEKIIFSIYLIRPTMIFPWVREHNLKIEKKNSLFYPFFDSYCLGSVAKTMS
jgi:hypothetical protein